MEKQKLKRKKKHTHTRCDDRRITRARPLGGRRSTTADKPTLTDRRRRDAREARFAAIRTRERERDGKTDFCRTTIERLNVIILHGSRRREAYLRTLTELGHCGVPEIRAHFYTRPLIDSEHSFIISKTRFTSRR